MKTFNNSRLIRFFSIRCSVSLQMISETLSYQDLRTPPFIPPQAGGRDVTLFCELPPVYEGTEGGIA